MIISGGNANEFARRLGIEPKRWANYERGMPFSREVAFLLWGKLGVSPDWVWFGVEGNLDRAWKGAIEKVQKIDAKHREIDAAFEQAKAARKQFEEERRKALQGVEFAPPIKVVKLLDAVSDKLRAERPRGGKRKLK
jgi:transcriptional regulator with XRE-family HTH domain